MSVLEGKVAFVNLVENEVFRGQDTGKRNLTLLLSDEDAKVLSDKNVRLRTYKGAQQRKFSSKFDVEVVDTDGETIPASKISWGDKVRVQFAYGDEHPQWGTSTYLNKVKLLEKGESEDDEDF